MSTEVKLDQLKNLREEIDTINENILDQLAARFRLTRQVGELKQAHDLPPLDTTREAEQMEHIEQAAKKRGLNPDLSRTIFQLITSQVVNDHQSLRDALTPESPMPEPLPASNPS